MPGKIIKEFGNPTIFWDHDFLTDRRIRPDIIVLDRANLNCHIIDVAIQNKTIIAKKTDLKAEITRLFAMQEGNVKEIPVVIGALGSIPLIIC